MFVDDKVSTAPGAGSNMLVRVSNVVWLTAQLCHVDMSVKCQTTGVRTVDLSNHVLSMSRLRDARVR